MQAMRLGAAGGLYEYEVDRYKDQILQEYNVESHYGCPCSCLTKYAHD